MTKKKLKREVRSLRNEVRSLRNENAHVWRMLDRDIERRVRAEDELSKLRGEKLVRSILGDHSTCDVLDCDRCRTELIEDMAGFEPGKRAKIFGGFDQTEHVVADQPQPCPNGCGKDLRYGGKLGHWTATGPITWCEPKGKQEQESILDQFARERMPRWSCCQHCVMSGVQEHVEDGHVTRCNLCTKGAIRLSGERCDGCEHCAHDRTGRHASCLACDVKKPITAHGQVDILKPFDPAHVIDPNYVQASIVCPWPGCVLIVPMNEINKHTTEHNKQAAREEQARRKTCPSCQNHGGECDNPYHLFNPGEKA